MSRVLLTIACGILSGIYAYGSPVISEFMADNVTTVPDENGDFSDWIEIHNPAATAISLDGWYLTDSTTNLTKWKFPAVTLQPGEFLVVWASSKNRRVLGAPLHTNFSLAKEGEYLALVSPGGTLVKQEFAPKFLPQGADESYGSRFLSTKLVAADASGRYKIPASATEPAATWRAPSYDASTWSVGAGGFGFGVNSPGIAVRRISKNGKISSLVDALALLALPPGHPSIQSSSSETYGKVNFLGDGPNGNYAFDNVPLGGGGSNYVLVASGFVTIRTGGVYTFGINSDDGGQVLIDGVEIIRDQGPHAAQDSFGRVTLAAGTHTFRAVMFEGRGDDSFEFFAAAGAHTSFNPAAFRMVGDVGAGGLPATTTAVVGGGLLGTDLRSQMTASAAAYLRIPFTNSGVGAATAASLVMRYNDGFAAWLNGSAVATGNVPASLLWNSVATASRTADQTFCRQAFNVTASLPALVGASNVLAIQGLNSALSDSSFLVASELIVGGLDLVSSPAFYAGGLATPGWINGSPSSLGRVADTRFSMDRGFFTAPISLAITTTTPGAVIRYTTDGSVPTDTNGTIYTAPLSISTTTVVRARASLAGWTATDADTQTYLFPNDVIRQSANGSAPPGWPTTSGTDQILDFGMDPDIVNHANPNIGGPAAVKAALLALPSLSVTTGLENLFNINGSQGIYANALERGFAWERPASLEWLIPPDAANPSGKGEFQIDAGVRIRGGISRESWNPKHSLRFLFREEYGAGKLNYPLFGQDAAQEFDKIDLRTSQNISWSRTGSPQTTFLREEACRQAQLDMGHPGSHVRYVHLYLNGRYWGLYSLDERTEAAFAQSYLGGNKADYDVVKIEADDNYNTDTTDGNLNAWKDLWNLGKIHRAAPTNQNYFRMMGLAADGITPTSAPVLLDADSLIDYLLLTFWTGNLDGCTTFFFGEKHANNWYAIRRRDGNQRKGFIHLVHDFEFALLDVKEDRTGPFGVPTESSFAFSNPLFLHQDLIANPEYRMRWADRIHRHLFNDGKLTAAAWRHRIDKLDAFVEPSIIAESARWGDAKTAVPFTKQDWLNARKLLFNYLSPRGAVVLKQLRADHLYPKLDAPELSPAGGHQQVGTQVTVRGPTGATLYFMPDGSDPRAVGGALRAGALRYVANPTTEDLIPMSSKGWKWRGDGKNQGTAWRKDGFNDKTWRSGKAELGYGDRDEATRVPIMDINPKQAGIQRPATYYFRKSFTAKDIKKITKLALTVKYDDAFAVYLNGVRVAGNLPVNPAYNYYSGRPIEDTISRSTVSKSRLRKGKNTLCIEVHQASKASKDLSMNLALTASRATTATPLKLTGTGEQVLRFRARSGTTWSALSEATYQVGTVLPTATELVVSEISFAPQIPNQEAEFVELLNASTTTTLDLSGARFTEGIQFTFPANTQLIPRGRVLVVKNAVAFTKLYGSGKPIAGIFQNATGLSNTGERLRLEAVDGTQLLDFSYATGFPWPASANGLGRSMILTDPRDPANPLSWRPSSFSNGNPGTSDAIPRARGQSLLDYATGGALPSFDPITGRFSITRPLGADAASLRPQWSSDLMQWSPQSLTLISDTPDSFGNSTLKWQLDPLPPEKAFLRLQVTEKP